METLKKYLPLIIIGIIGIYAIRKLSGGSGPSIRQVVPLTPSTDTSYSDPLLPFRAQGFAALANVAQSQIEAQTAKDLAKEATTRESITRSADVESSRLRYDLESFLGLRTLEARLRELDVREILGLRGYETQEFQSTGQFELAKYLQQLQLAQQQFLQSSYLTQLDRYYASREQDRQLQQGAIERAQSNQRTQGIVGSIGQTLAGIFGNRGGSSIFRTPPTFPGFI